MRTIEEIKVAFQPVSPAVLDAGQKQKLMIIANRAQEFAEEVLDLVPECADRTHALRLVLDAKFWCVQAITHYGPTIAAAKPAAPVKPVDPAPTEPGPTAVKSSTPVKPSKAQELAPAEH